MESLRGKLVEEFGEELFVSIPKKVIKDWQDIKTFEDACEVTGDNPLKTKFTEGDLDSIAYEKLKVIYKAINNGRKPNMKDLSEKRWYPWFTAASGGVGFSPTNYDSAGTITRVCSFLCTFSEEQAEYIGKNFTTLYDDFMIMK